MDFTDVAGTEIRPAPVCAPTRARRSVRPVPQTAIRPPRVPAAGGTTPQKIVGAPPGIGGGSINAPPIRAVARAKCGLRGRRRAIGTAPDAVQKAKLLMLRVQASGLKQLARLDRYERR